ncbi:MAG: CDP-alcohol phosphatidyltransferase family protein [Myxococcales bacterium]|nr:CDP-alcohol phosphatidyltransferase family protein [Myxococcales bacterium]
MNRFHARDLLLVPGLLSLARVPLAVAFALTVHLPALAFTMLVLAGVTDVLDGWYARRHGQVTMMGTVIDPITDKLFVGVVVVSLVVEGSLEPVHVLLLSVREIGEVPMVLWLSVSRRARERRAAHTSANVPGKLATVLQFATVCAALWRFAYVRPLLVASAAGGALAAASYWYRALRPPPAPAAPHARPDAPDGGDRPDRSS